MTRTKPERPGAAAITAHGLTNTEANQQREPTTRPGCLPVVAGIEITTDPQGRFNLNALHRASASGDHKKPSQWLRREETKNLVAELINSQSADLHFGVVSTVRGGNAPGTFVHELLAVEYSGWISPAFRLQVNQKFLDFRSGKTQPALPSDFAEALRLAADYHEENERLRVDSEALHRLTNAEGSHTVTAIAKNLKINRTELFEWLKEKKWIYKSRSQGWLGHHHRIKAGHVVNKMDVVNLPDGRQKAVQQLRITNRGAELITKRLQKIEATNE